MGFTPAHTTSRDGTVVQYYERGAGGKPVVLVHGLQLTARIWTDFADSLPRDWRLIVPNLRGRGGSGRPDTVDAYAMDRLADDLEAVCRGLTEPFAVVGWSMGASVAWEFSRRPPARHVNRWVFVSSSPDPRCTRRLFAHADAGPPDLPGLIEQARQRMIRSTAREYAAPYAAAAAWLDFKERDYLQPAPELRAPSLFIHGDQDEECPIAPAAALARRLNVPLATLAGAGHNPMNQHASELAQLLKAFIDADSPAPP